MLSFVTTDKKEVIIFVENSLNCILIINLSSDSSIISKFHLQDLKYK